MSDTHDLQTAKERVERVFRYLMEMHQVRTPPVVRLDDREWILRIDDIPESAYLLKGYDPVGENATASMRSPGDFLIKVGRPKETECPEPSVVIKNWLRAGWDDVDTDPESIARKTRKGSTGSEESFSDSEDRVEALAEFLEAKKAWASEERGAIDALGVFSELFELHVKLQREAEKYQLFLGDGILVLDHPAGKVHHPTLLQRVELKFDACIPEFTIVETDSPEVYTPLLRHVDIDGKAIRALSDTLAGRDFHPLGGESTSQFLKDFVQRFWTNGQYFENELEVESPSGPYLYRQPQLYLGYRNYGLGDNIARYLDTIPGLTELPESLYRVVGIDTGRSAERAEDANPTDVLLTKHANREQEQVIRRLEETGAVIVQGPPGTGKSHTIANLIGHLLAQNKSILVTSHASKALRVVRQQLAKPLQSLCVSVLESDEESSRQLEESITGIVNYLASTGENKLTKDIERLTEARETLSREQKELRVRLLEAVKGEYRELEVLGESVTPSEAARKMAELAGTDDWISGPLPEGADPPLSSSEIHELYALNAKLTAEDEKVLHSELPDLGAFPSAKDFAALYDELSELDRMSLKTGAEFWLNDDQNTATLRELLLALTHAGETLAADAAGELLESDADWIRDCLEAGRVGGERAQSWRELRELIEACSSDVADKEPLTLEYGPSVEGDIPQSELAETCRGILAHFESGRELSKLALIRHPEWGDLIASTRVDTGAPAEALHFQAILHHLEIRAWRDRLGQRWDRQMLPFGLPEFAALGPAPEREARRYAEGIALALVWHPEIWSTCESKLEEAGLDWTRLSRKTASRASRKSELQRTRELTTERIEPLIEARIGFLRKKSLETRKGYWLGELEPFSKKDAIYPLTKQLATGIKKGNYDTYSVARDRLEQLMELRPSFARREELLDGLAAVAPGWASAVRERQAPHADGAAPGDVEGAWRYRQWEQHLARQAALDLDELQEQLDLVTDKLIGVTADYVEKLSWQAQLRRTGLKQQQALNGWLGLHKKIGKGTGKHVPRLKEEARRTLVECRTAVPVWIMPLSRVVESFDLATTRFDVVIIDEASQSDVMGLVAFALGKEVVVVGDHEQVSPYAIGQRGERIHALIDEILREIPNKQLYDGKTSVYDLARQSFGATIRLVEHFRCVPDIIQFSNQLCYGGEIRALREASSGRVYPHLIAHRVEDGTNSNGVNKAEALEIASLVSAICRLDEYKDSTIGVICLVGTDQALYIDSLLRMRLTVSEYQKRRILCGNASQFQGDERDIILLSIVNSPSNRPLMLRQRDDAKKVFNVAASRARDQLWVVHSLDPGRDLKHGDLRLQLISHAENPEALRAKPIEEKKRFNSELEKRVFQGLKNAGHRLTHRYQVGEYTIDLVVEGEEGKRVAVQCDGDRTQTMEALTEEMDRQLTLERLGWEFIRVRGTEFFSDPARVQKKLTKRLAELEIRPRKPAAKGERSKEEPLDVRVVKRAEMIRSRWKDIPTVTSIRRKAAARVEDTSGAEQASEE